QIPPGQARHGSEEAQVPRLLGLADVEVLQGLGVLRSDRPQMGRRPVAEGDVGLPVGRVRGRGRGRSSTFRSRSFTPVLHGPILAARGLTGVTSRTRS